MYCFSNLTLHYDRMMLLLDPTPFARGLARKKVDVVKLPGPLPQVRAFRLVTPQRV
jgi:hypothetical protein